MYFKHGMTKSRTYKSWDAMKQRCTNPNSPDYYRYGAVGVKVCDRWLNSFENFLADMNVRPPGTTIHRYPKLAGNYEPGNCIWGTDEEQSSSKVNTQYLTYNGETERLVVWAEEMNIPVDLLRRRYKAGLTGDDLFAPSYSRYKGIKGIKRKRAETRELIKYDYNGQQLTIEELAVIAGVNKGTLEQRLRKYKMPLEKAMLAEPLPKGKSGHRTGHKMITAFGKTQSLTAWATEYNLPISTLKNRLFRAKLPPEEALKK